MIKSGLFISKTARLSLFFCPPESLPTFIDKVGSFNLVRTNLYWVSKSQALC